MDTITCIQKAIDFVEDNLLEELKIDMIASQAYMSSYQFHRVFSILCDTTIGDYIRNRRLTLAGMDIASSKCKIIDIAYQYGYESPESFSRAFTRFHGVTPISCRSNERILQVCPKISVQSIVGGKETMEELKQRGYTVKENGPVYYTKDMNKTIEWFQGVLGWYGNIDGRDKDGVGTYGCVLPIPGELVNMKITTFNGIHMFYGVPSLNTVSFMRVDSIDGLYNYVKKSGWEGISEIKTETWGGKECDITTIDGSIMRFFQLND